jgi:hypothetical protein
METHLAKGLLQIMIGAWQIRNLLAEKQMGTIAPRHLEEMGDRLRPSPSQLRCMPLHMPQDDLKPQLALFYRQLFGVIEHLSELVNPSIRPFEHFPSGSRGLEPLFQEALQAFKLDGQPLFSATRSIEALICLRRSDKVSPEADNGRCPSSVKELRTAKQYSRAVCTSSPLSSSRLRSIARMPRTCFFSSFFACRSAS